MYSQEGELEKLRVTVHNKARVEGCITETFTCKEIMNFSSNYFSRANNVNAHTTWYHIVEEVPLSELSMFQWKGKGVGASSAHYVTDDEWNYTMLYMYMNMEEVQPYFELFDRTYWKRSGPSFPSWFRLHVVPVVNINFLPRHFFISNSLSSITHI
jgi:hypothetical protein